MLNNSNNLKFLAAALGATCLCVLAGYGTQAAGQAPAKAAASKPAAEAPKTPELELKAIHTADTKDELSGMLGTAKDKQVLLVADGGDNVFIYRGKLAGKRFAFAKELGLPTLKGWADVVEAMKVQLKVGEADRRLDLEGIAACGETLYLISERVRQVLVVDGKRSIRVAPIDFEGTDPALWEGGANAGFEGVAADCQGGRLYVAKERDPRRIYIVELATWTVIDSFDVPGSDRQGQKVINPFTGQGLFTIGPDFADLAMDGSHLYALERNTYEIVKIEPKSKTVVGRVSYYKSEKPLYETGEPFGVAEALIMTPDEILVGIDNNGKPLSHAARTAHDIKGEFPVVMRFKRPAGF